MERIILEVDDSVGKKWRSASEQFRSEVSKVIEKQLDDILIGSNALPGNPLSLKAFKAWIMEAEKNDTVNIIDAKKKWARKRKQLKDLTR